MKKQFFFLELVQLKFSVMRTLHCFVSGFDVGDISEDSPDDLEGLDAAASHVANLLSTEPADSKYLLQKIFNYS